MKKILLLIAILFLVPAAVLAQDSGIYIAPNGNNNNSCTRSAPCLTFTHAHNRAQAGDTIVFLPGVYGAFTVTKSDLTIRAEGEVIIDSTSQNGIRVRDQAERVVVDGFIVQRTYSHAILVTGKDITIQNSTVRWSIFENATGSGSDLTCRSGSNNNWGSGIKVQVGGENVTIRRNTVYEICGEGIAITRGVGGLIEHNVVYDTFSVNIYVDNSIDVIARQNHSYCTRDTRFYRGGNPARGITLGNETYSGWGNQLRNVSMTSNFIDGCRGLRFYNYFSGSVPNVSVTGNYFQNSWDAIISVPSYIQTSGNVIAAPPSEWWNWDGGTPIPPTFTRTPTATRTPTNVPTITPSRTPTSTATRTPTSSPIISTVTPTPIVTTTPGICPNPTMIYDGGDFQLWLCR
jgi:hypothetical protein